MELELGVFISTMLLPFLLLSLSFLLLLILIKRGYSPKPSSHNLPPGPWKLPIIGSIHHLLTDLPHHAFHRLAQKHGPVMLVRLGQVDVLVVSSREAASEIFKSQDLNFSSRPQFYTSKILTYGFADIVFSQYGDYWRQIRKICTLEILSARRVRSFHSLFEEEISNFIMDIKEYSSKNPVNLSHKLLSLMNTIIARCAFGRKSEKQQELISPLKESLKLLLGLSVADLFPHIEYIHVLGGTRSKAERIHGRLDEIIGAIIEEHELNRVKCKHVDQVEDLLDVLLRIKDQGEQEIPLTYDNIKAVILDLFIGGTHTSATVLEWAMSELMKHPESMEKAKVEIRQVLKGKTNIEDTDLGELHYLKLVIKETLRLHPPGTLVPRECIKACQVAGYNIPAGTRVFVNAWAIGRDPRYWDDAEKFKPERFSGSPLDFNGANFEFVPFGGGRRICPGITFGVATICFTLAHLLINFNWELPNGMMSEELDMTESFGFAIARKTELCLLATPLSSSTV